MKDRLKGFIVNREFLIGISMGVFLVFFMRVFVVGVYLSVEKMFFYNVMFFFVFGVVLFIIVFVVVGKFNRRIGVVIVVVYVLVFFFMDVIEYIYLIVVFVILVVLVFFSEFDIKYVMMGFVVDLGLRVFVVGGELFDFLYIRIILSFVVFFGVYVFWKDEGKLLKFGFGFYVFVVFLEFGFMYLNVVLRYFGINFYYFFIFVGYFFIIVFVFFGGFYFVRKFKIVLVFLILGMVIFFVKLLSLIGFFLVFIFVVVFVESVKIICKGELGVIYFFLVVIFVLGVYIGRDIGLVFMEDKLEVLIVVVFIVYVVVIYGKNVFISILNRKEVVSVFVGFVFVLVIVLVFFNMGLSYVESKKDVFIWSYNIY